MKKIILSAAMAAVTAFGGDMLTTGISPLGVDETTDKLANIVKEKGLMLFDVVAHSKLAKEAGLEMTDTNVVIFGSPKVGTLLMQCSPAIALELPMKFLIYKKESKTVVAYEDVKSIAARYGAGDCAPVAKMSELQANLLKAVSK